MKKLTRELKILEIENRSNEAKRRAELNNQMCLQRERLLNSGLKIILDMYQVNAMAITGRVLK